MFTTLSLVTSVKDYVEVVHKLIESDSAYNIHTYNDLGALLSYIILIGKQFFLSFVSFDWIFQIRSLPIHVPDIASAMISEISVLDGYFHNAFTFLEKPISYGDQNLLFYSVEKFTIGLINSLFLFLPTSTASLISLRRFAVQGVEAGYLSGLGTLLGSLVWIASILFGWRFVVLPWLSLDVLRYSLGLILLVKYMWDSYTERRMSLEDLSKWKIFLLTFLLSFTEQTSLFPFLGNLSIGSDATILESFPSNHFFSFFILHGSYLLGLGIGGLSLLYFTCWFWENPALQLYNWTVSAIKINARFNYKFVNFTFLYLTMICAMSNMVYFGLDYTLTKPLGFVTNDRLIDQKTLLETSFLSTKASDRNTRMNMGRRGRRERWKKSVQRYRNFDASLYGEGIYDLFTIEDLNYGFDRFWLRRKMRNHDVPFRLFPGPWVRSFKKQLSRPRLESFSGPRLEFFRILFEQVYHPIFHEKKPESVNSLNNTTKMLEAFSSDTEKVINSDSNQTKFLKKSRQTNLSQFYNPSSRKLGLIHEFSTLRKFVRKVSKRIKTSKIAFDLLDSGNSSFTNQNNLSGARVAQPYSSFLNKIPLIKHKKSSSSIYSKRWKEIFSKINHNLTDLTKKQKALKQKLFMNNSKQKKLTGYLGISDNILNAPNLISSIPSVTQKMDVQKLLSKKDIQILHYRSFLTQSKSDLAPFQNFYKPLTLLHPIKFYLHKEKAFQRKLKFYGVNIFRNFGISNNSPYFRIMMKKFFYYYKPTLRWERTMRVATLKKIRRKGSRKPLRINFMDWNSSNGQSSDGNISSLSLPFSPPSLEGIEATQALRDKEGVSRFSMVADGSDKGQTQALSMSLRDTKTMGSYAMKGLGNLQKPTHMYSLIGKRATRYRSQIYKDVLQHWYYSPFNRLLLKLDIDTFIRRQPASHFLTKNEEHLLHFRRALLMDHYETLRWYTYMQHYRSMKTRLGGTKSFASRFYNQQFQGTFKKIRHLFSVTPSFIQNGSSQNILKWDQPLYHEYPSNQHLSILNDSLLHEELLVPDEIQNKNWKQNFQITGTNLNNDSTNVADKKFSVELFGLFKNNNVIERDLESSVQPALSSNPSISLASRSDATPSFSSPSIALLSLTPQLLRKGSDNGPPQDLINQSKQILGSYLIKAGPIRQELIAKYLEEKNYWELTRFLFKGQKTRGTVAATQSSTFLNQEKEYLYTNAEKLELSENERTELKQLIKEEKIKQNLWMSLIKKSQTTLFDRKALKNYLKNKMEKQGKRKKIRQKQLKERLERIHNWLVQKSTFNNSFSTSSLAYVIKAPSSLSSPNPSAPKTEAASQATQLLRKGSDGLGQGVLAIQVNETEARQPFQNLSTGIQKAYQEAIQMQEGFLKSKRPLMGRKLDFDKSWKNNLKKTNFIKNKSFSISAQNLLKKKLKKSLFNISFLIKKRSVHPKKSFSKFQLFRNKTFFWSKKAIIRNIKRILGNPFFLKKDSNKLEKNNSSVNEPKYWFNSSGNIVNIFKPRNEKSLQVWKRKQHVLTKRKQTRKILKQLKKQASRINSNLVKPNDLLQTSFLSIPTLNSAVPRARLAEGKQRIAGDETRAAVAPLDLGMQAIDGRKSFKLDRQKKDISEPWNTLNFTKDFQTRRARRRGARFSRNRGAIKKPTLNDKLKRQFLLLKRYGKKKDNIGKEQQILKLFEKRVTKQRRTRQRENRFWRRYKKPKYSQNRRKMKKRKRYSIGKIRNLNKELKRVESYFKIRKWWWKKFLPDFRAHIDTLLQFSKEQKIEQKLNSLSFAEIMDRNAKVYENVTEKVLGEHTLQIGNYDYKPLYLSPLQKSGSSPNDEARDASQIMKEFKTGKNNDSLTHSEVLLPNQTFSNAISLPFTPNSFGKGLEASLQSRQSKEEIREYPNKFLVSINPMPFYAGWDETLRKFIVTNRLLSRREAGYKINPLLHSSPSSNPKFEGIDASEFSNYPLKGMNVATTLYWQVPFTTYDPDQFFALGRDGFAPIGWKRFKFQYTKQTMKPIIVKTKILYSNQNEFSSHSGFWEPKTSQLFKKMQIKVLNRDDTSIKSVLKDKLETQIHFTQKRNKRIKRHPRSPASFPSGPLISEVLPVHYIYVFYKRDRLPRDRYISRRLRRSKDSPSFAMQESFAKLTDWTLRKRVKPRRKYHRKRKDISTNIGLGLRSSPKTVLRRKFRSPFFEQALEERQRPLSKPRLGTGQQLEGRLKERYKQRKKNQNIKSKNGNLRIRQLRRRVQRQVFRPVWRYRPHPGGWLWPGDYFRLELIKTPTLNAPVASNLQPSFKSKPSLSSQTQGIEEKREIRRKVQKKKKRNIQNWQIQQKKYLLQKHNIKVLKKRLQKSQNHHKINHKIKELSALVEKI